MRLNSVFTPQEKRVIIFLCFILLLGGFLRLWGVKEKINSVSLKEKQIKVNININNASLEEIKSIPTIGENIAQEIINYRNSKGKFDSLEDLLKIKGIGEKKLAIIKDFISF
ncbi:MAG: ComEA family DNA-binding protein [Candidatus Omnitrophica bacterium]|nr:ComEA family DNA-binding protein [Candidatus Omnitrophota bacterium]